MKPLGRNVYIVDVVEVQRGDKGIAAPEIVEFEPVLSGFVAQLGRDVRSSYAKRDRVLFSGFNATYVTDDSVIVHEDALFGTMGGV